MSSPTSVIRRYTPPTCTLEIAAKESPLSRWMGQTALKHLRFKLSFDDPRVNDSEWVTIHGDRTQLQALSDAVTTYVQNFLNQSATYLNRNTTAVAEPATELNPVGIYLQPKGLVSHELHLGSLATENSGSTIRLSAVQLADLASALDEFAADAIALPNLDRRSRWINTPPAWGTIAAAAIAAIGVGSVMLTGFNSTTQTAANQAPAPSSGDQRLAIRPLPSPSPSATLPSSPLPLASLPPNSTPPSSITTPPTAPTTPTPPQQMPNLKVEQQPPVDAPPPQIQIPVQEVPVAAIPNQTKIAGSQAQTAAPNPAASEPAPSADIANDSVAASRISPSAPTALQASPSGTAAARSNAAGTIPQVTEAKTFFQSRWQPPKELTSAIEYRLVLAPDGKIQRIIPLGELANRFLDRTPMPVSDEPFVSPVKSGTPVIRLILSPNGTVQTFLESQ